VTAAARLPAWLVLGGCYALATSVAWASDDVQEIATECVCMAILLAYWRARRDALLFWVVVFPIPAFVLFHERLHVRHWVAYIPAAISLAMAWRVDRRRPPGGT
jgi:hypothetical protein